MILRTNENWTRYISHWINHHFALFYIRPQNRTTPSIGQVLKEFHSTDRIICTNMYLNTDKYHPWDLRIWVPC